MLTFNDENSSVDKILATPEKVEEVSSTKLDDKLITNERNRRKCRSNKEKIKLKSPGMLEYTKEEVEINKKNDDRFNSFSNLNFFRIFSDLLEEGQRNSSKISTSPPERIADISVCIKSSDPARP